MNIGYALVLDIALIALVLLVKHSFKIAVLFLVLVGAQVCFTDTSTSSVGVGVQCDNAINGLEELAVPQHPFSHDSPD